MNWNYSVVLGKIHNSRISYDNNDFYVWHVQFDEQIEKIEKCTLTASKHRPAFHFFWWHTTSPLKCLFFHSIQKRGDFCWEPLEDTFVSHCWASSYNELLVIMQRTLETRLGFRGCLRSWWTNQPYPEFFAWVQPLWPKGLREKTQVGGFTRVHKAGFLNNPPYLFRFGGGGSGWTRGKGQPVDQPWVMGHGARFPKVSILHILAAKRKLAQEKRHMISEWWWFQTYFYINISLCFYPEKLGFYDLPIWRLKPPTRS